MRSVAALLRTWRLELDPPGYVVRGELSPLPAVEAPCGVRTLEPRTPMPASATRRRGQVSEVLPTLDHPLVAQVAERVRTESHDTGAEIVVQGAMADRFHIIVEGEVDVWVREGDAERRTGHLSTGDYFGEIGLLTGSPRNAVVRALGPVTTLSLAGDQFRAMLEACDLTSQERARVMRARIVAQDLTRVFPSLDAALAARMPGEVRRRVLAGGEDIVRQGEPAESFYVLLSGTCDVLGRGAGGELFPLAELGPGEFFGEVGLMLGVPRTATVRARTDVELLELSRDAFNALAGDGRFAHEEIARVMRQRTQS